MRGASCNLANKVCTRKNYTQAFSSNGIAIITVPSVFGQGQSHANFSAQITIGGSKKPVMYIDTVSAYLVYGLLDKNVVFIRSCK